MAAFGCPPRRFSLYESQDNRYGTKGNARDEAQPAKQRRDRKEQIGSDRPHAPVWVVVEIENRPSEDEATWDKIESRSEFANLRFNG
jgi:hypothetical protein